MWERFQAAVTKAFAATNDTFDGTGRSKEQMANDWINNYNKQLSDRFEKAHAGMDLAQKETEAKEFIQKSKKILMIIIKLLLIRQEEQLNGKSSGM